MYRNCSRKAARLEESSETARAASPFENEESGQRELAGDQDRGGYNGPSDTPPVPCWHSSVLPKP